MTIESYYALPLGAQFGVITFCIAIILLVIAQVVSIASYNARANLTSFEDLHRAVEKLTASVSSRQGGNTRPLLVAPQNPRPVRHAVRKPRKQGIDSRRSKMVLRSDLQRGG